MRIQLGIRTLTKRMAVILLLALTLFASGVQVYAEGYPDVQTGAWYYASIEYCTAKNYVQGYPDGKFIPNQALTRAELAVIMNRVRGFPLPTSFKSKFRDVPEGKWYTAAVQNCTEHGVFSGYGNGLFGPNDKVTREQAAVIVARAFGMNAVTGRTSFNDDSSIASWAVGYVGTLAQKKLISGMGNNIFSPKTSLTRAQICTMIKACQDAQSNSESDAVNIPPNRETDQFPDGKQSESTEKERDKATQDSDNSSFTEHTDNGSSSGDNDTDSETEDNEEKPTGEKGPFASLLDEDETDRL